MDVEFCLYDTTFVFSESRVLRRIFGAEKDELTSDKKQCNLLFSFNNIRIIQSDCLCGLVVRVPGYRSRCPGFDSRNY
jgi:hypothetical protein